eukprot:CAMPEP_0118938872 /NCGR_PEP_ID=MMETSP1169-20130426/27317_1 /TAXON_ID=36882 /ORGANISM="Pyramimonas obovata, Strain CCMP722" /LENGTH=116 /DNA_ID=CAMNT_0006882967 /DNA_START=11 /DNA_END=358 /DNA_ORIENTATION=-
MGSGNGPAQDDSSRPRKGTTRRFSGYQPPQMKGKGVLPKPGSQVADEEQLYEQRRYHEDAEREFAEMFARKERSDSLGSMPEDPLSFGGRKAGHGVPIGHAVRIATEKRVRRLSEL